MQNKGKNATLVCMSTKGLVITAITLILLIGGGTVGFLMLRQRLVPATSPAPTTSEASPSPTDFPIPIPSPTTECKTNDDCAWFTKVVVTDSGKPTEQTYVNNTCANQSYMASCGVDCQNRGNIHPYDKTARCQCDTGSCDVYIPLSASPTPTSSP